MKKYMVAGAGMFVLASGLAGGLVAGAAVSSVSGSAVAGSAVAAPGYVTSPSPTIYPAPTPVPPPSTDDSGFLQFNNLTIESVSGIAIPGEIVATLGYPTIVPMMGASSATGASAGSADSAEGGAPQAVSAPSATASGVTCFKYESENDNTGTAVACPTLPATGTSNTQSAPNAPATGASGGANASAIASPPSFMYRPYRIEIDASTKLSLRDRTPATLANFSAGDTINVFGYYNADGSIQAYLIRDLSKPAEAQTIQLENLTLLSISGTSAPATLAVTQTQYAPCYGFDQSDAKSIRACPLGVQSFSANAATKDVETPEAMRPNWAMLRKYVVNVSAQTIILDRNRTKLTLADLQAGDTLNVYGGTSDNGQTIDADIVRDLSIPPAAVTTSGKVTQVNADGSFVIQTNDGRALTVQNPIQVGAAVTLTGVLDTLKNVLSQVSQMYFGNNGGVTVGGGVGVSGSGGTIAPTPGVMNAMPINGGPIPTSTPGRPNIY